VETGETFSIAWGGAVPFSAWREEVLKASQCREKKVQGGLRTMLARHAQPSRWGSCWGGTAELSPEESAVVTDDDRI